MKTLVCVLGAFMLFAVLSGCRTATAPQKVVVGADLEISGAVATLGKSAMEGMQLATDQQNAQRRHSWQANRSGGPR